MTTASGMATASGPVSGPAAAQAVLGGLRQVAGALGRSAGQPWWHLSEEQVGEVMGLMGVIRHQLDRVEVAAAREGIDRGLHTDQGWSATDWVRRTEADSAPAPATGHAARVSRVAQSAGRAEVSGVHQAVAAGVLSMGRADQLIRFQAEVAPVADPDLLEIDLQVLLDAASDHLVEPDRPGGPTRACRLSDRELGVALARTARMLKPEEDLERQEERQRAGRMLFKRAAQAGMTEYRWVLDPEGAAVVDSAISGLSAPAPAEDGTPDTRSAAQRRAEALLAVVQRGVSSPGKGPRTDKAQVVVTITMHDLLQGLHGAGVTTTGTVLSPATVRRMACEAAIIPMVLGSQGEVLDLGHPTRLFTRAQRRAMWHRDGGCTFPDCTIPAQWCETHHVDWWSRGGPTDLANGALLCPRHHTHVHKWDLTATVTDTRVTWHT
jgi:hypothetical protein